MLSGKGLAWQVQTSVLPAQERWLLVLRHLGVGHPPRQAGESPRIPDQWSHPQKC